MQASEFREALRKISVACGFGDSGIEETTLYKTFVYHLIGRGESVDLALAYTGFENARELGEYLGYAMP